MNEAAKQTLLIAHSAMFIARLGHQQLTMTEVSAVFSRNRAAATLEVIVDELVNVGTRQPQPSTCP